MKSNLVLERSLITTSLIVLLSLWASLPFYLERYGGIAGTTLGAIATWEVLALIIPIAGVVATVYGSFYKNLIFAFLVGVVPYSPLIFLGIPGVLFLGTPMGLIGAGSASSSMRRIGLGIVLIVAGVAWWGISTYLILRGFR